MFNSNISQNVNRCLLFIVKPLFFSYIAIFHMKSPTIPPTEHLTVHWWATGRIFWQSTIGSIAIWTTLYFIFHLWLIIGSRSCISQSSFVSLLREYAGLGSQFPYLVINSSLLYKHPDKNFSYRYISKRFKIHDKHREQVMGLKTFNTFCQCTRSGAGDAGLSP